MAQNTFTTDWREMIGYEVEPEPLAAQIKANEIARIARDNARRDRGWSEAEIRCGFATWER